jgi:hypothetical protein
VNKLGNSKAIAIVVLVVGIVILLVSVFASPLGLGNPAFGPRQMIGTVVGAVVAVVGLVLLLRK